MIALNVLPCGRDYLDPEPGEPLTPRQREAMSLLSQGLTNYSIASTMGISYKTVELYMHTAYKKSGIKAIRKDNAGRKELILWASTL